MLYAAGMMIYGAVLAAASVNSGGPTFSVHGWQAEVIILGAVAAGLVAIWKIIVPFVRACLTVARTVDTLAGIADEFRPNGGGSLHDRIVSIDATLTERTAVIDRIDTQSAEAVEQGKTAVVAAAEAKEAAEITHAKLGELWAYSHESHHAIVTALTKIGPGVEIIKDLASKLADKPQPMEET